jgi:parallel beta-helix repeat protein
VRVLWLGFAVVVGLACSDLQALVPLACAAPVVDVSPSNLDIFEDSTGGLVATVTTNCATEDVDTAVVAWVSRDVAVVTVASTGDLTADVTAVALGQTYVVATFGAAKDSARITVQALTPLDTFPCVASATTIAPGDDGQAKINAQATGVAFTVCGGVHRLQQWVPKTNQSFTGQTGAILDGGRTLTGWTAAGTAYYVGGQTQQLVNTSITPCDAAHPGCFYPEQLWVDGHLYEHMTSLGGIGAGKWYFDYAADRIYLPFDPTDSTVVTSVARKAISGSASGVTVEGLTIQHYANMAQEGALDGANGWTIEDNTVCDNHGINIKAGGSSVVRDNVICRAGQLGLAVAGSGTLVDSNEIHHNMVAGYGPGSAVECGATKFVRTTNLVVRANHVYDNGCNGLWTDVNNIGARFVSNLVEDNACSGIIEEVGYEVVIDSNTVTGNGFTCTLGNPATGPAGIFIANSRDAEVMYNTVQDNKNGITGYDSDRPNPTIGIAGCSGGPCGTHDVVNMEAHHNTVRQNTGRAGGVTDADAGANPYSAGNSWHHNAYTCTGATRWRWSAGDLAKAAWVAVPQESGSTYSGC